MSLQKQVLPIKIGQLDTLTDIRQLSLGALTLLENLVRKKSGALQKRLGATASVTALAANSNRRLASFNDELVSFSGGAAVGDGMTVESYSSTRALWTQQAGFSACMPKLTDVYSSESSQSCYDIATNGNYALHAWEDSSVANSVLYRVTDLSTGSVLLDGQVTNANKPKCVGVGTSLLLFYCNVNTLTVKRISISGASALSVASTTNIGANIHANHSYDVQARLDVTRVAIAYHSTVPDIKIIDWNPATDTATASGGAGANLADRCVGWLAQDWNTNTVVCAIADSANGVRHLVVTRATMAFFNAVTDDVASLDVRNVTGAYDGTNVFVYFEVTGSATHLQFIRRVVNGGAITVAWANVGLASKAFNIGATAAASRHALVLSYDSPTQKTYFVQTSFSLVEPTCRMLYGNGGGLTAKRSALSGVGAFGSLWVTGILRATRLDTVNGFFVTQTNPVMATLDFSAASGLPWAKELGGTLFMSGGFLRTYDLKYDASLSRKAPEAVPLLAPEAPTLTGQAGGSLTALGTYKYKAVYCMVDNRGRIRRSAPSDVATVTLTAGQNQVLLAIQHLDRTTVPYTVEYYRNTFTNGVPGGSYYRVLAFGALSNGAAGTSTVASTDTLSDAVLETQEPLYTDSGELPNYAPPSFRHLEVHRGRIWGISTEDDREVWYSKELQAGLGIGFHPDFKLRLEGNDGGAYALASMDDKLIAFKRNSIYVTTGDGPDNRGQGNTFPPFTLVSRNVGTVEPESVLLTPAGIMFKSMKGIWLLTRALELQYIGAGVDTYNSLDITASALVDDQSHARFTTSSGRTLVYDYSTAEWMTFTNQAAISAVLWNNKFTYVLSTGVILQETAATYQDAGANIAWAVEVAPVVAAGTGGWERVYELRAEGDYFAASTFTIKVAYDFESTIQETLTRQVGLIQTDNAWRLRARFARRQCEAVKLRFEGSDGTQAFSLSALALIIGVAPGKGSRIKEANAAT